MRVTERIRKLEKQMKTIPQRRSIMSEEQKKELAEKVLKMSDEELEAMPKVEGISLTVAQKKAMAEEYLRSMKSREADNADLQ